MSKSTFWSETGNNGYYDWPKLAAKNDQINCHACVYVMEF